MVECDEPLEDFVLITVLDMIEYVVLIASLVVTFLSHYSSILTQSCSPFLKAHMI